MLEGFFRRRKQYPTLQPCKSLTLAGSPALAWKTNLQNGWVSFRGRVYLYQVATILFLYT